MCQRGNSSGCRDQCNSSPGFKPDLIGVSRATIAQILRESLPYARDLASSHQVFCDVASAQDRPGKRSLERFFRD
jgi:hypothetical protein